MKLTVENHDAGFVEVPLRYRRGQVSEGFPAVLRVRALSYIERIAISSECFGKPDANQVWPFLILLNSLPKEQQTVEFINKLTAECADELVTVALELACGSPQQDEKTKMPVKSLEAFVRDSISPALASPALTDP